MKWALYPAIILGLAAAVQAEPAADFFSPLPLGSVHPRGWLRHECEEQRDGLTGHAEELYAEDLGTNSGWLGGTGEKWERGPYYMKGLVALAYTLDDAGLKQKAQKWMDWLLDHQRPDGQIGPVNDNDWWPRMPAVDALRDYYEATSDPRVPTVLSNYFRYMQVNLPSRPLVDWGKSRAGDAMEAALWLYRRNHDQQLLTLIRLLHDQAYDWTHIYASNDFMAGGVDFQPKHNVNIEQAFKFPFVWSQISGRTEDRAAAAIGWTNLMREDGLACGINSGTEFLAGHASVEGVELCSIVEAMLSFETAEEITGEPAWGDRLETIAYNALPAALADHIRGIQYFTLPNNVMAIVGAHGYNQDYANGTVPGPDSGYPCCRCNFHMGWPKLVQNAWAATSEGGLVLTAYAPSDVKTKIDGQPVEIEEQTAYPFSDRIELRVTTARPVKFPLALRIPGWCVNGTIAVNGVPTGHPVPETFQTIKRTWRNGDRVTAVFPMTIRTNSGPSRAVAIQRGPLVYSLKIGERWTVKTPDRHRLGFDEMEVHAATPWNYALRLASLSVNTNSSEVDNPYEEPPVSLRAEAKLLPDWTIGWRGTHAFEPPCSPVESEEPATTVTLVPFGAQTLRVSWFPCLGEPMPAAGKFRETFDATWPQRWTTFGGNWLARAGALGTVPASANGAKAIAVATAFTNFIYEADVTVGTKGDAGVIFRAQKPDIGADAYCGYYAGISAETGRVELGCASNAWHSLAQASLPLSANVPHHLRLEAAGPRLRVFIDHRDKPSIDIEDTQFSRGMIGVRDYCRDGDHSISRFSNLAVTELNQLHEN